MKPYLKYTKLSQQQNEYVVRIAVLDGNDDYFDKTTIISVETFDLVVDLLKEINDLPSDNQHRNQPHTPLTQWLSSFCGLQEIGSTTINHMIDELLNLLPTTKCKLTPHGSVIDHIAIKYFNETGVEHNVDFV